MDKLINSMSGATGVTSEDLQQLKETLLDMFNEQVEYEWVEDEEGNTTMIADGERFINNLIDSFNIEEI